MMDRAANPSSGLQGVAPAQYDHDAVACPHQFHASGCAPPRISEPSIQLETGAGLGTVFRYALHPVVSLPACVPSHQLEIRCVVRPTLTIRPLCPETYLLGIITSKKRCAVPPTSTW